MRTASALQATATNMIKGKVYFTIALLLVFAIAATPGIAHATTSYSVTGTTRDGSSFNGSVQITNLRSDLNGVLHWTGVLSGVVTPVTGIATGIATDVVGQAFTVVGSLTNPNPGTCTTLDLSLSPIQVDAIGQSVSVSPISIDASSSGLLGSELCQVASIVNSTLGTVGFLVMMLLQVLVSIVNSLL